MANAAFAMPFAGPGHVAQLRPDGDDAQGRRDGLRTGRAVLQRPGLADGLRRDRRHQWRDGMLPESSGQVFDSSAHLGARVSRPLLMRTGMSALLSET